jgi:polysaccharide export outer membrane protein
MRIRPFSAVFLIAALALTLSACARLPSGAPARAEILADETDPNADYAVYPVTRAFLPTVATWPLTGKVERLRWLGHSHGPRTQTIRPGDMLNVQIWDSSENSLLTGLDQRVAQLGEIRVAPNGSVFVPYIGDVNVNGMTPDLARAELQRQLEAIVPSAQVQLALVEGRQNSVDLVGGVASPGSYPMPDLDYSVLSLIAAGGGINTGLNNPQIRLVRGHQIFGTSVARLLDNPRLDTRLRGGDRVFVEEDTRYFLSFGASGEEDQHAFTREEMSAMDAVSVMGGINDSKADPKGLLILREYAPSALRAGVRGPRQTRVVFTVDLTSADGLFSARKFQVNPGDLLIATESPVNDALTLSNIIGNIFGVFSRAGAL